MGFFDFIDACNAIIWGPPLLIILLGTGAVLFIGSGFFQITHFGWIMKNTFGAITKKNEGGEGTVSAWEAATIAVGGAVGSGNVAGVATAVAAGGPGAIFWMWVCAILGMLTKCAEVSLALHYRTKDASGDRFVGGPTYYMEFGLGEEKHWGGAYKIIAIIFGVGIFISWVFTTQCYTAAESLYSTFGLPMNIGATIYLAVGTYMIAGGLEKLGKIASYLVPIMCIIYIVFGLFIIAKNIGNLGSTFAQIFAGAFSGTAATGGFAGATMSVAMQKGLQRGLYSNEAGWGTSPMVHATSIVDHPIEQGLWGCFEVFVDTIMVCSMTGLVLISTGEWCNGLNGATLTLTAFENQIGFIGRAIVALSVFLFAMTTTTGWYTYYDTLLRHATQKNTEAAWRGKILWAIKVFNVVPGWVVVILCTWVDATTGSVWGIVDLATGIPTFANLIAVLLLCPRFFALLKDYKARYMGIGEVDPEFYVWYADKAKAAK